MFSVVLVGNRQYKVSPGDEVLVEKLEAAAGSKLQLPAMLISDDSGVTVGKPTIEGRTIGVTVMGEQRGQKLIVFKYTPKKRYRVKNGHRQTYTRLKVD